MLKARLLSLAAATVGIRINGERFRLLQKRIATTYEPSAWRVLDLVRPGDVFVDVGGNVGLYAIAAARRGARVVALEPDPRNAAKLRRHARLNRVSVDVIEVAASNESGQIPFVLDGSEMSSVPLIHETDAAGFVRADRLDALTVRADVIKIDVEGFELQVVRGADRLLSAGDGP